ncbi:putative argonaute family protein [Teratosphaeria destructans]|uniref:Argonaute family protein n=1 Tax=Teratosphaeria destructans TaxID=418781 RepID=A0A9W7SPL2_9PEZI|nr:putative argonaute family protein [Teratosphaeria destructans]
MAGAAKQRAHREKTGLPPSNPDLDSRSVTSNQSGMSSGDHSSSGRSSGPSQSARPRSDIGSTVSGRHGYDGNADPFAPIERDPARARPEVSPKNFDVGASAWQVVRGDPSSQMCSRPPPSKLGIAIPVALNTYNVTKLPTQAIYQFDVQIGNGVEKRGFIKEVWGSRALTAAIGGDFIFDGNKLAWNMKSFDDPRQEKRITIDMDKERGRAPKPDKEPTHVRVVIRQTNRVRLDVLEAYMKGKISFDNAVLESINFLDHLLREWPRLNLTSIKRSFFQHGKTRNTLGAGVEAFKGVYQSIHVVHGANGGVLSVNVDVANGTFWTAQPLSLAAFQITGKSNVTDLANACRQGEKGPVGQNLKKLRKLRVFAKHRGAGKEDRFVIERLIYQSARDYKFEHDGKTVLLYDYYLKKYNLRLQYPDLPLVKMTKKKGPVLPMEILMIEENQRYVYKCDERQTSNMIRFAVTPPQERAKSIQQGIDMLKWSQDPNLKAHGMQISGQMTKVEGRLIPAPVVGFAGGDTKPGTSGRWDLKSKKFLLPNSVPLKSWAISVVPGRRGGKPDKSVVENFVKEFIKIYKMHGGRVENTQPAFSLAQGDDVGQWVTAAWNSAGNQSQARPQILVFILPDKDSQTYGRIKRSAECRYGVVSQCMQYAHVQKCQAQYISNVCMKFNAKLGGTTCRAMGPKSKGPTGIFSVPTMIIGADVSHAAPGALNPSMAAMTVSMDRLAARYAAACETNGFRVEMITTDNIKSMLKPMIQTWCSNVGGGRFPSRIIYFRDGVSEGQYSHVIQQEVHDMKALLKTADPSINIPFLVVVGSKRHHVRFFPPAGKGDRNDNPLPGTLVETGVTHPFENDFYLNSHAAIKGTARPMHYHVLMNEPKMPNEEIQTLIYEHSYQYMRATTPISQHPAIYYAHLASNRAIPHDPSWSGSTPPTQTPTNASRPRSGSQSGSQAGRSGGSSSGVPTDFQRLMPMPNQGSIMTSMWYI